MLITFGASRFNAWHRYENCTIRCYVHAIANFSQQFQIYMYDTEVVNSTYYDPCMSYTCNNGRDFQYLDAACNVVP